MKQYAQRHEDDPQFDITNTQVTNLWWVDHRNGGMEIAWETRNGESGEVAVYLKDGVLRCDNETRDPRFLKRVMCDLVDRMVMDEPIEDPD